MSDLIVGITGKMGAGKDTAAGFLQELGFQSYSLATPLKKIGEVFGFEKEELYGTQEDKLKINSLWGISGRTFLQKFGTDICRDFLPTILPTMDKPWIKLFQKNCKQGKFVLSDIRFLDEASSVRSLNGIIVRCIRTNELKVFERENEGKGDEKKEAKEEALHPSEMELEKISSDFTINNYFLTKEEAKKYLIESISSRDFKVLYISNGKDTYQCCPYSGKVSLSGTCEEGKCDCKKFKVTSLLPNYKFRDTEFYDENGIYSLFFIPFSHFEEKTFTVFANRPMSSILRNQKLLLSLKYTD